MTDKQILESLLQGKKLISKKWHKNEYIHLNELDNLVDERGKDIFFCVTEPDDSIDTDSLEEYIEYVDFFTAMKHIANGGKAQRKGLYGMLSLDDKGNLVYKDSEYKDGKNSKYASEADFYLILNKNDIDSQEWILF